MRESVCLVLNERESIKARAAEALEAQLWARNITTSRTGVGPDLMETLYSRRPKIIVLDYLLGDHWTGLDVLSNLQKLPSESRPGVIFLTDEPSVKVAVEAVKLGALNYIEIDQGNALARAIAAIEETLIAQTPGTLKSVSALLQFDDLIANSLQANRLHATLAQRAVRSPQLMILSGSAGCGLSCLAQAIHTSRPKHGLYSVCDLRTLFNRFEDSPEFYALKKGSLRTSGQHTIVLDHCEEDDGSILRCVAEHRNQWWSGESKGSDPSITVVALTNDRKNASSWVKSVGAEHFEVPDLKDRSEDIAPLVQRFVHEARSALGNLARGKQVTVGAETISVLSKYEWPFNIRELKSLITNCVTEFCIGEQTFNAAVLAAIDTAKERSSSTTESPAVSSATAAFTLFECRGSHRLAASRLGVSLTTLHTLLSSSVPASVIGEIRR